MSDSTTPTRDRRRWRTPIVAAAVSGGLLLGGYGIAAAADPTPTPSSPSTPSAPETDAPNRLPALTADAPAVAVGYSDLGV